MRKAIWIICTALLSLAPLTAGAQTTTTPTTGTSTTGGLGLTKADFADLAFMYKDDSGKWVFMNKTTFDTYFNRRRCECNEEIMVRVSLLPSSRKKINGLMGTLKLRAGDDTCVCQTTATCADSLCRDVGATQDMAGLLNGNLDFTFKVRDLFASGRAASTDPATTCERDDNQNLYIWIDGPDSDLNTDVTDASTQLKLDGIGPPTPTGITASGGEGALEVSWKTIGLLSDMQGYQLVCSRGLDVPVYKDPPRARFSSPGTCAVDSTTADAGTTSSSDAGVSDGGGADSSPTSSPLIVSPAPTASESLVTQNAQAVVNAPEYGVASPLFASLQPAFVCSDLLTSGTSTRINGLENGIPYIVGVVAVDLRGNPSKLTNIVLQTPTATRDFYSGYRQSGGAAQGGYCALAGPADGGRSARAGWLLLGLGLVALRLRRRQRRDDRARGGRS